jgi:hypothetical protein
VAPRERRQKLRGAITLVRAPVGTLPRATHVERADDQDEQGQQKGGSHQFGSLGEIRSDIKHTPDTDKMRPKRVRARGAASIGARMVHDS